MLNVSQHILYQHLIRLFSLQLISEKKSEFIAIRVRKKCEQNSLFIGFYRQNMKKFELNV
jgi:hypothetical protein